MSPAASLPVIPVISERKRLCILADVSNGMRKNTDIKRYRKKGREMERERKETKIRTQEHSSFDMAALNTEAAPALSSVAHIGNGVWIVRCSPGKSEFVEHALIQLWMFLWISVSPLWTDWTADLGHCRVAARCVPHWEGEVGLHTTSLTDQQAHTETLENFNLCLSFTQSYLWLQKTSEYREWVIWTTFMEHIFVISWMHTGIKWHEGQ